MPKQPYSAQTGIQNRTQRAWKTNLEGPVIDGEIFISKSEHILSLSDYRHPRQVCTSHKQLAAPAGRVCLAFPRAFGVENTGL